MPAGATGAWTTGSSATGAGAGAITGATGTTGTTGTTGVSAGMTVKVAVTERATSSVTVQVSAVPLQAPLQPANVEPDVAIAVSVTVAPFVKSASQVTPQAISAGLLLTVPLPVPSFATVR